VASSLTVSVLGPLRVDVDGHGPWRSGDVRERCWRRSSSGVARSSRATSSWSCSGPTGPGDGRNALQALVSRTRRALGPAGAALVTAGEGYLLDLPPEAVDAERFERAVIEARRSAGGPRRPSDAAAVLGELLGAAGVGTPTSMPRTTPPRSPPRAA
jgi:hypothetical protein